MLNPKAPIFDVPEELRGSILSVFRKESKELIDEMKRATKNNDIELLKACAHKLKGSCGTIGAMELSDLAAEIEDLEVIESKLVEKADVALSNLSEYLTEGNQF